MQTRHSQNIADDLAAMCSPPRDAATVADDAFGPGAEAVLCVSIVVGYLSMAIFIYSFWLSDWCLLNGCTARCSLRCSTQATPGLCVLRDCHSHSRRLW